MPFGWWPNYRLSMNENRLGAEVHYNVQTGDIESLSLDESTNDVIISDPESGEELQRVPKDMFTYEIYTEILDSAVEDPVQYYLRHVQKLVEKTNKDVPADVQIAFEHCRQKVEVTEK
jgi:hypothetical protein